MAEKVILVCDVCERPATTSVSFKVNGDTKSRIKDYCKEDLQDLIAGSRPAQRGRRRGVPQRKQMATRTKAPKPTPGPGRHDPSEVPSAEEIGQLEGESDE